MRAIFSSLPFRLALAGVVAVLAVVVVAGVFREPQRLCMQAAPGTVVTMRGVDMLATFMPLEFSIPTGRSSVAVTTVDGQRVEGTIRVYDAHSPVLSIDTDAVEIDFCTFLVDGDTYATEHDGVITVYKARPEDVVPTGFTLTRAMRDGVLAPARAIVSPSGIYVAYITWDVDRGATELHVAEVSGKNDVVLASLTPEQGEMALEELSWSGSWAVAYAEVLPMTDGPDAEGNAHEKTLYRVDVATHVREGVHIVPMP